MPIHQTARTFGARRVPTATAASGCWQLGEVTQARRADIWPTTGDRFFSDVVLLLQDAATDESSVGNTVTLSGSAAYTTTEPKVGTHSLALAASGDVLTVPAGSDFAYGTGDFCVEAWFFQTAGAAFGGHIWAQTAAGQNYFGVRAGSGNPMENKIDVRVNNSQLISTSTYSLNAWHHVAVVRDSGTVTIYLDGQASGSAALAATLSNTTYTPTVGAFSNDFSAARFNGYIDALRVTKAARYTANFTPSTVEYPTS